MRSSPSFILLCLSAVCLFALASSITLNSRAVLLGECGPAGSGLPRCNGTITASYDALNCQGNVTYSSGSSEEAITGQCYPIQETVFAINDQCAFGQPTAARQYAFTPNDRGNCTQPLPALTLSSNTVGACINDHSSNTSHALLCDPSQVPFQISTTVTAGPVVLEPLFSGTECYAPDRCDDSLFYSTNYNDEHCGRSVASETMGEPDLKLGVCYDNRDSPSGESMANIMYSFDGTYFRIAAYYGGCSGTLQGEYKLLVNTCFIVGPGRSTMFKTNAAAPTPVSQMQGPTGASSSMHGSLQMSIFVSLIVSFLAMLLSVTA